MHIYICSTAYAWWRHQMETFSALLDPCAGNSPVTGEFPAQTPVTRSFNVFFDLHLNKRLRNHCEAGDLRRHRAYYDVCVMAKWPSMMAQWHANAFHITVPHYCSAWLPRMERKGYESTGCFTYSMTLTHWGRVTHNCVSKLTTIVSNNGLSPDRQSVP